MLRLAEILLEPAADGRWAQLRQLGVDRRWASAAASPTGATHAPEQPWEYVPLALYRGTSRMPASASG